MIVGASFIDSDASSSRNSSLDFSGASSNGICSNFWIKFFHQLTICRRLVGTFSALTAMKGSVIVNTSPIASKSALHQALKQQSIIITASFNELFFKRFTSETD
jgi:hypothetical protein